MTTTTVTPYRAALTPLSDIVATVTDWAAPSPCEGWSALDVLDHVLTTQRALLTARGLTIVTNDLRIGLEVANRQLGHLVMLGGELLPSVYTLHGPA